MISKVYAYENEYFYIELNDKFKETSNTNNNYIFTKDNEYISVTISKNKDNYDISKFTEDDIKNQKEYLTKTYSKRFNKYSSNTSITNIELKSSETTYYLEYDIFYETKKSIGYNIYQKCRMYTTNKYVYSILYNSDKEIKNTDIIDTFKIKDSYLRKVNITTYIISTFVLLIIILFIDYLFYKKRR